MVDLKKVLRRMVFYIRQGYNLASLPFVFLGYASSIYYLMIVNIPMLHAVFPRFSDFLILSVVTLPLLCGFIGYVYMKKSWLYRTDATILTESNPYLTVKLSPVSVPATKLFRHLAKKEGLTDIYNELDGIIRRSEE